MHLSLSPRENRKQVARSAVSARELQYAGLRVSTRLVLPG